VSAVSFGDKPAGAIASLALRKTAEMYAEISPSAAKTITENSYVDDIVDSFCDESTATEVIQKSNEILAKGGFRIKEWTVSSYPDHESVMKLGQDSKETQSRVLGVGWNPSKDDLQFEISGYPIKKFGSQGQQKSFLIALKLAEFDFIKNQSN
jgi:recombinational DNA repair ATPase RecF